MYDFFINDGKNECDGLYIAGIQSSMLFNNNLVFLNDFSKID